MTTHFQFPSNPSEAENQHKPKICTIQFWNLNFSFPRFTPEFMRSNIWSIHLWETNIKNRFYKMKMGNRGCAQIRGWGEGGLSKWLQYNIRWWWWGGGCWGSSQMITVSHRVGPENYYSVPRILEYYIRNMISKDLTKNSVFFFSWLKIIFWAYVKMITSLHKG